MDSHNHVYSNEEITVTYEPGLCIHSGNCARELAEVFRTSVIPWINLDNTESDRITDQIKRCPSAALKFHYNNKKAV